MGTDRGTVDTSNMIFTWTQWDLCQTQSYTPKERTAIHSTPLYRIKSGTPHIAQLSLNSIQALAEAESALDSGVCVCVRNVFS